MALAMAMAMASSILGLGFRSNNLYGSKLGGKRSMSCRASSPWLMLPPVWEGGEMIYKFYSLVEERVLSLKKRGPSSSDEIPPDDAKIVGSSHGWLAFFDQKSQHVFLSNPISGRHIRLPRIGRYGCCVSRLVLSSSPDEQGCRATVASSSWYGRIASCEPRVSSEWTPLGNYDDFAYPYLGGDLRGISYAKLGFDFDGVPIFEGVVARRSQIEDWIIHYSNKNKNFREFLKRHCTQAPHLVFSDRFDLPLIVMRFVTKPPLAAALDEMAFPYASVAFVVLEQHEKELRVVEDLKGLAIFVGMNHTFAIPAAGNLKPNSIYFTDISRRKLTPPDRDWWGPKRKYGGHDIGIFDYQSKTISPCYYSSC